LNRTGLILRLAAALLLASAIVWAVLNRDQLNLAQHAEDWKFVAFVRLVPFFPFNLTNYALNFTRIGFVLYDTTSLICMAPGAIAYTWLGYAGRQRPRVLRGGMEAWNRISFATDGNGKVK
jgi:uncharacterized membrane protein YdjX (TVP38/TMEM64 family)